MPEDSENAEDSDNNDDDADSKEPLLTSKEFALVVRKMKNVCSVKRFLRTIMWEYDKHYASAHGLRQLLQRQDNPFVKRKKFRLVHRMLESHEWGPIHYFVKREVLAYGKNVVGKFQPPIPENVDLGLERQLAFLNDRPSCDKYAPRLTALLASCSGPQRSDSTRELSLPIVTMIMCQLAAAAAPRSCNKLSIQLGMTLSNNHLTRRGLDLLSTLGISASYQEVNTNTKKIQKAHRQILEQRPKDMLTRLVVWDNLNRVNNVRETRAGDEKEQMNITTGLIKHCSSIPKEGLSRSLLHWESELATEHILPFRPEQIVAQKKMMYRVG